MHSARSKVGVWLAVLGFGAATAIGPWMHFAPGLWHWCNQCTLADSGQSHHACHGQPCVQSETKWQDADGRDCPICQFLTLAKSIDYHCCAPELGLAASPAFCLQPRLLGAIPQCHYDARAPPAIV